MLMMLLLFVTIFFAFPRFFEHLHFFFQVFTSEFVNFRDTIKAWLWLWLRFGHWDDLFYIFFSFLLLVFGDDHVFQFVNLLKIAD